MTSQMWWCAGCADRSEAVALLLVLVFMVRSTGFDERRDLEAIACLPVVMFVGDAGVCPLTETGGS